MNLALYTTIHPGTRPYLRDWYASVQAQSDQEFEIWVGLHGMTIPKARNAMGAERDEINWVSVQDDATPAQVRIKAWEAIVPMTQAIIMVDADDVLHPSRVHQARHQITTCDVAACRVRLVDQGGASIGYRLPPEGYERVSDVLPSHNAFGLTNTTYRTGLLSSILDGISGSALLDWEMATWAWLMEADMEINDGVQMDYRQHPESTLALIPPYTTEDIYRATEAVLSHFDAVVAQLPNKPTALNLGRVHLLYSAQERVENFAQRIVEESVHLKKYLKQLNRCDPLPLWWSCVAHPKLEFLWTDTQSSNGNS